MSKRNRTQRQVARQRDALSIATDSVLSSLPDGRLWSPASGPLDYPPPRTLSGSVARRDVPKREPRPLSPFVVPESVPYRIGFVRPSEVVVCVRRRVRRQVLHALKRTGKGARSPRRQSRFSSTVCK